MIESAFSQDTVIAAAPDVVSANMGEEEVILNLTTGIYYGLDEVGARIWSLIQEAQSVTGVLETLLTEYEVERDQCLTDMLALLEDLAEAKLIEVKKAE